MPHPLTLPDAFIARMLGFGGAQAWLQELPELLDSLADRWCLRLQPPYSLSYNYVCPAVREDGTGVVLKAGLLLDELAIEIAALRAYNGSGIVKLLDAVPESGALLLEKLDPGSMLVEVEEDEEAIDIAAGVMERLWIPAPDDPIFPTAADWGRGLDRLRKRYAGGVGPFPRRLVETAEALFSDLHASAGEQVLLHGDLHHFNILRADRQPWLALDPKGLIGEREYEIGALLRNPDLDSLGDAALRQLTVRRIDQLSERLGFDRKRLAGWTYAQAVLSSWWSVEDNDPDWPPMLRLAVALQDLI